MPLTDKHTYTRTRARTLTCTVSHNPLFHFHTMIQTLPLSPLSSLSRSVSLLSPSSPLSLDLSLFSLSTLVPLSLADTNEHLQAHFSSHTYTHRMRQVCTHTHTQAVCLVSSWLLGSALLLLFLSIPSFNIVCLCTHMLKCM